MKTDSLKTIIGTTLLVVFSLACSLSGLTSQRPEIDVGATALAGTLASVEAAQTALAPTFQSGLSSDTGSISGTLIYPSEVIFPQRVVATNLGTNQSYYVDTQEGQSTYEIGNLPSGTYHVISYQMDYKLAAGYSQFVLCGLKAECSDHSLVDVVVTAGVKTENINPQDWYAPEGTFPLNPIP